MEGFQNLTQAEQRPSNNLTRRDALRLSFAAAVGAAGAAHHTASGEESMVTANQEISASEGPISTRMFWTWDHSTEWQLNKAGAQTFGASNYYTRWPEVFVEDYSRLLRWCGAHGVDAVVVWGLLRDTHGGLESARKLCDVADENGVRLLCGVGLNAYGGVYYQGESPYSLENHLAAHRDLIGVDANGKEMVYDFGLAGQKKTAHACPSRTENQEFAAESLQWLFKEVPRLGGVQIEAGDTGVCQCDLCKERRQHPSTGFSWEDMALMYPMAADAIRSVAPTAWIVCETYSHPEPVEGAPGFGEGKPAWADACHEKFPDDVFVQWVCDNYVEPKSALKWTDAGAVSKGRHRNVMRAHFATYWGGIRGEVAFDWLADMVQKSIAHGFDGVSVFGEVSPFHTGAELNYLALEHFGSSQNPDADVGRFLRDVAGPLLGGEDQAKDFLRFARLKQAGPSDIDKAVQDICRRCGKLPRPAARRWAWLAQFLESLIYL